MMNDQDVRELTRIRFALRELITEGVRGEAAAPLIDQMAALGARQAPGAGVDVEAWRWRALFRLDGLFGRKIDPKI